MRRSSSIDGRPSLAALRVKNDGGGGGGAISKLPKPKVTASLNRLSYGAGVGTSGGRQSYGAGVGTSGARQSYGAGVGTSGARQSYGAVGGTSGGRQTSVKSRLGLGTNVMDSNKRSRSNMVHYGGHHEQIKDSRPVTDRSYQHRCVLKLIEFLSEQKYPYKLSPKLLLSPTNKDFIRIFEFLVGHFCPKFKCGPKIEEEIPRLMREFGYPFLISKSAMFTVGTPHTWPYLLAALAWLRERIELSMGTDIESLLLATPQSDEASEDKILFQHMENSYKEFLNGFDMDQMDEELEGKIRNNVAGDSLNDLAEKNRRLTEELDRLEQQPDELRSEQKILDNLQTDVNKLSDYAANLTSHKQQQVMKLRQIEDELTQTELELKQVCADNLSKQRIRDKQEFSPADIVRINAERDQLHRSNAALVAELEHIDTNTWELEMSIRKQHDKLEVKCRQYNEIGYKLQMIPVTAENASGFDYELTANSVSHKCATVKPALTRVLKQCDELLASTFEKKLHEEERLDQLGDLVAESNHTLKRLDTQHQRLVDTLEANKEKHARECEQQQHEVDSLEQEVAALKKPGSMSLLAATKALQDDKAKYAKLKKEREDEIKQNLGFLMQAGTMVVDHKANIQKAVRELAIRINTQLLDLRVEDVDTHDG